jgi:hypothetical protein
MEKNKWSELLSDFIASIFRWSISAAFIMWGWNTLAPHINCPTFGYWEIFAMRMGLAYVIQTIVRTIALNKEKEEE